MTRKDYERLAKALGDAIVFCEPTDADDGHRGAGSVHRNQVQGVRCAAEFVADELEHDNPAFDRKRFWNAITNYANAHRIKLDLERRGR